MIDEDSVETHLALPVDWLPAGGLICGVRVAEDQTAVPMGSGSIVLIDLQQRNPRLLEGRMVAFRNESGVRVRWIRQDSDPLLLDSEYASKQGSLTDLGLHGAGETLGLVVKWIGEPYLRGPL